MKKILKNLAIVFALSFTVMPAQALAAEKAWVVTLSDFNAGTFTGNSTLSGVDTTSYNIQNALLENDTPDIWGTSAITKDGNRLYIAGSLAGADKVNVITTQTADKSTITLPGGVAAFGLALSHDETKLYVGTYNGVFFVIDTSSHNILATVDNTDHPSFNEALWVNIAPNGDVWVLAKNSGQGALFKIDSISNTIAGGPYNLPTDIFTTGDYESGNIIISKSGEKVYFSCRVETNDGVNPSTFVDALCIYNIASDTFSHVGDQPFDSQPTFEPLEDLALSLDGSRLYKASELNNSVAVFNTTDDTLITRVAVGQNPVGVDITKDGSKVFAVNSRYDTIADSNDFSLLGTLSVIDTASNSVIHTAALPGIAPFASGTFIGGNTDNEGTPTASPSPQLAATGTPQLPLLISALLLLAVGSARIILYRASKY